MNSLGMVPLTRDGNHAMEIISNAITAMKQPNRDLQVLEAGCGRKWGVNIGESGYILTGLDMDPEALRLRLKVLKDLDKAIVGDLLTAQFDKGSFDVIYNSYVLEHVSGAQKVLENFARWLRPNGLLVIKIPDPQSVHGFMSRVTPHWFHVLYYRFYLGEQNAGKPGYAPYPVCYDRVVSRSGIRRFCSENGLTLVAEFGMGGYRASYKTLKQKLVFAYKKLLNALSFGYLTSSYDDLLIIIRKAVIADQPVGSR